MASDFSTTIPQSGASALPLEIRGEYAVVRVCGVSTLDQGVRWVTAAIIQTRERGLSKLLMDATPLNGLPSPSVPDRYLYVREWAEAGRGMVRLAMLLPAGFIDPQRFGVMAAANAGLITEVFTDEPTALAWLLGRDERPGQPASG